MSVMKSLVSPLLEKCYTTPSQRECIRIFVTKGNVFSTAASLLPSQTFMDTAIMYAFFRVVDDLINNVDMKVEERRRMLIEFEKDFWESLEHGNASDSPFMILPAVIETVNRLQYDYNLFHRFFKSMFNDAVPSYVCLTREKTLEYLDGSAAVVGEIMLPILCQHNRSLMMLVKDGAKALGIACQLTSMLRDMVDDAQLGRVYLPDVKSEDISSIESVIEWAEGYYRQADLVMDRLPDSVRPMIQLVRTLYAAIHTEIRKNKYSLHTRATVPLLKKLNMARKIMNPFQCVRLVGSELLFKLVSRSSL